MTDKYQKTLSRYHELKETRSKDMKSLEISNQEIVSKINTLESILFYYISDKNIDSIRN